MDKEMQELAKRLRDLRDSNDDWPVFADFCMKLIERWRISSTQFGVEETIEEIAKGRLKWSYMIQGVENVFMQMGDLIKEINKIEKEDDDE